MPKKNYKSISSLPLIATTLLVSLSPALAKNSSLETTDPKLTRQQILMVNNLNKQACTATKVQEYVSKLGTPNLTDADFNALVKCGAQAVPALTESLKNNRAGVRANAAYILGQIGSEAYAAVPALSVSLEDKEADVRAIAAYALGQIGPEAKAAVPTLIARLIDNDSGFIKAQVIDSLGSIGPNAEESVPVLAKFLRNQDCDENLRHILRTEASSALEKIGTAQATAAIASNKNASWGFHCTSDAWRIQNSVQSRSRANLPMVCKLPVVNSVLPRCR
jgi:hypothetical protein